MVMRRGALVVAEPVPHNGRSDRPSSRLKEPEDEVSRKVEEVTEGCAHPFEVEEDAYDHSEQADS